MPEGDTIWYVARRLRPVLVDQPLTDVLCRWPRVVYGLRGRSVRQIDTHGKHLLLRFTDATTLRIHLKMTGRWRVFTRDPSTYTTRDLGVALTTERATAACYNVPDVERIDDRALSRHRLLSALGPDVLAEDFDADAAVQRAPLDLSIAEALLDQRIAAGVGNVWRAEILFVERQNPFTRVGDLPDPVRIWQRASDYMRASLASDFHGTTGNPRHDHYVYGRTRRACLRCGTPIRAKKIGGPMPRAVYWCPRCQP
jgi:endonuclease-8